MLSKGCDKGLPSIFVLLMVIQGLIILLAPVDAVPAEVVEHRLNPEEPNVDSILNVTVEFDIHDEPLTYITIQWCVVEAGGGGACGPMEDMSRDSSGRNYSIEYPAGTFQNATYEFHVYDDFTPLYDFEIHVAKNPKYLILNATIGPNTIHPNETVTAEGDVRTDLGVLVEGAQLNLSIADLGISAVSFSDESGIFSLDLMVPESGYYILNLSTSFNGLVGYREHPLTVSEWSLPNMALQGTGFDYGDLDAPPGADEGTFYQNGNVTFDYEVSNSGTDKADNITITVDVDNGTHTYIVEDSDLLPGQRYPGTLVLNTSEVGEHTIRMTVEWEQAAPFPEGFSPPEYWLTYEIVPRPEWTGHTVFLEMFTQVTCAPCVYVEEALEILHEEGINFEYVVYALEDTESMLIAESREILTTPVLFVDGDLYRKDGSSNDITTELDEISELVHNAASLERPPVMLEFTEGEELTLSGYLDPEYRSDVSGIIKIYRIEPHSSIRNNQSIPMANRYMGSVPGQEIDALQPGEWFNLTLNPPEEGESYVAVLESDEGKIINSVALEPGPAPMAFITDDQVVRRIDPSSSGTFILTVDRFQFEEEDFGEIEINISSSNIPEGWSLTIEGAQITQEITKLVFGFQGSSKEKSA